MKKLLLAIISILFVSVACSVQKATINAYVNPNFKRGNIKCIAVFPMKNASIGPGDSQQIVRKITMAINRKNPSVKILVAAEAVNIFNENDLADDWALFLENYISSGIPNSNILKNIGSALQVDAIIQGEVINIFQQDGVYGENRGITRITVRFTMLDTKDGKMVWDASSDGIRGTVTTVEKAPPVIEAIDLAINKILKSLPKF